MSICFTKGLCCPIGAIVIGNKDDIIQMKQLRKGLGGGIWHTGIIAAPAAYAIKNLLPEVKKDNELAYYMACEM